MSVRIIGDVHTKIGPYTRLAAGATHSIQVGDLGFTTDYMLLEGKITLDEYRVSLHRELEQEAVRKGRSVVEGEFNASVDKLFNSAVAGLTQIDPVNHRVLLGNHDNPDYPLQASLGDYGVTTHGGLEFGYIRGAFSPDAWNRTEGVDYWPNEELTYNQFGEAIDLIISRIPDVIITHDCPSPFAHILLPEHAQKDKSRTVQALSALFDQYQPRLWICGHYHRTQMAYIQGTVFLCLGELSYMDIDPRLLP